MTAPPQTNTSWLKLTTIQTIVATLAGVISITGGLYSLRHTLFGSPAAGSLAGVVRDQIVGKPLLEASVEVADSEDLIVGTLYTGQDGRYSLGKLKEGAYVVKAAAVRHVPQVKTVTVRPGQGTMVNFDLVTAEEEAPAPLQYRPPPPAVLSPAYSVYRLPETTSQAAPIAVRVPARPVYQDAEPPRPPQSGQVTQALLRSAAILAEEWVQKKQAEKTAASESH